MMNFYLIPLLFLLSLLSIPALQSDTNHFGAGGVFELDLADSEIPLTPKQASEQKCFRRIVEEVENKFSEYEIKICFVADSFKA